MTYTALALVGVAATVVLDLWVLRTRLLTRRVFWTAYAIVVFFQLVTNGVLTGFRIVRYDGDAILGTSTPAFLGDGRIAFAPVEDLLFGFALVVQALAWWVWWGRRGVQREPYAGPPRWWLRGPAMGRAAGADGTDPGGDGDRDPS
jgi:lycopene cyclase domain-containing protein